MAKKTWVQGSRTPRPVRKNSGTTDNGREQDQHSMTAKHVKMELDKLKQTVASHNRTITPRTVEAVYSKALREFLSTNPHTKFTQDYSKVSYKVKFDTTGLTFQIGKLVRPTSEDVSHSLRILMEENAIDEEFLPDSITWDSLFGEAAHVWRKHYIYRLVENLDVSWTGGVWHYPYDPDNMGRSEIKILAAIWILQCWDHLVNYGRRPRPSLPGVLAGEFLHRTPLKKLSCPFCSKVWKDVPLNTPDSIRMRRYMEWLKTHSNTYHKWECFQPKRHPKIKQSVKRTSKRSKK